MTNGRGRGEVHAAGRVFALSGLQLFRHYSRLATVMEIRPTECSAVCVVRNINGKEEGKC